MSAKADKGDRKREIEQSPMKKKFRDSAISREDLDETIANRIELAFKEQQSKKRKLNLMIEHLGSDEKGRFVFIQCKICDNRFELVSIYGPNETDSAFLTQISKTLLEEIDCPLVVGGDFNAVINPALDKSQSDTTANPSSKLLNTFITELNLIDLWRIQKY